jgi:molybdopterin-containing oxidoreductase family membrane subunit
VDNGPTYTGHHNHGHQVAPVHQPVAPALPASAPVNYNKHD